MRDEIKIGNDDPFPEISIAHQGKHVNSNIGSHATYNKDKTSERARIMTNQHDSVKLSSLISHTSYLKFKKRFTLIELLVVISVIAILAGMLLPALGQAKGVAKRAQCMNNLKTIGMVTRLYQDDNADYLIPLYWHAIWTSSRFTSSDLFRLPQVAAELYPQAVGMREMPTGNAKNHNFIGSAFECPQDNPNNYVYKAVYPCYKSSYGFSDAIAAQCNGFGLVTTPDSAHPKAWKIPSRTVWGSDRCQQDIPIGFRIGNRDQPESAVCGAGFWHQKGANVVFLDLHVAHMIPSYTSPTGWHGVSFNASTIARQ